MPFEASVVRGLLRGLGEDLGTLRGEVERFERGTPSRGREIPRAFSALGGDWLVEGGQHLLDCLDALEAENTALAEQHKLRAAEAIARGNTLRFEGLPAQRA
eukprot:5450802-Alexandrium_andersonii.AAC.1